MITRYSTILVALCLMTAAEGLVASAAAQQSPASAAGSWVVPRTPDGHPDLQGNWTNVTITPFERPEDQESPVLTLEEVQERQGDAVDLIVRRAQPSDPDRPAPQPGEVSRCRPSRESPTGSPPTTTGCGYNFVYFEQGTRVAVVNGEPRSSLITFPSNGRIPELTPEGQRRRQERQDFRSQFAQYDHPELRPLAERCLTSFGSPAGPPPQQGLQQQLHNRTDGRSRDDHDGDGPRRADYPNRRRPTAASTHPSVDGRLVGPLGGRRARGRDHQHPSLAAVLLGRYEGNGAVQPDERGCYPLRVHGQRPVDLHGVMGRTDPDDGYARPDLRVRLPRGQLIRIGDGPRLPPHIRPWMGDSWGHWEGDVLVVETTNIHPLQPYSSADMRVMERFSRMSEDAILYEFTVNDPSTYTESWGGQIPMPDQIYEYACLRYDRRSERRALSGENGSAGIE